MSIINSELSPRELLDDSREILLNALKDPCYLCGLFQKLVYEEFAWKEVNDPRFRMETPVAYEEFMNTILSTLEQDIGAAYEKATSALEEQYPSDKL
jgi:hypothetical protein